MPTERGFAYRMKLEAMNRQGKRSDLTFSQVGKKLKEKYSYENLAEETGESKNQIYRYIRLTYLVKPLRDMVDGIHEDGFTIALNPAYELSFLITKEQNELVEVIANSLATPSLAQSQELKRKSQEGILSPDIMMDMYLLNDLQDLYSAIVSKEAKHYFKIGIYFERKYQAEVKQYYQNI